MRNSKNNKKDFQNSLGFTSENFEKETINNKPLYYLYILVLLCSCAYYVYSLVFLKRPSEAILIIIGSTIIVDFLKAKRKVFSTKNYYDIYAILVSYCFIDYIGINFLGGHKFLISIGLSFLIAFAYISIMQWINDYCFNK